MDQILIVWFMVQDLDSVPSSHPISVDVNNPDEINEIFDSITYGKVSETILMENGRSLKKVYSLDKNRVARSSE